MVWPCSSTKLSSGPLSPSLDAGLHHGGIHRRDRHFSYPYDPFSHFDDTRVDAEGFDLDEVEGGSGPSLLGAGVALIGGLQGAYKDSQLTHLQAMLRLLGQIYRLLSAPIIKEKACKAAICRSPPPRTPPNSAAGVPSLKILAHPAGLCLEVLLAFFMRDIFNLVSLRAWERRHGQQYDQRCGEPELGVVQGFNNPA